jgi:hypothetical protein
MESGGGGGRNRSLCSKAATSGLRFKLDTLYIRPANIREMEKFQNEELIGTFVLRPIPTFA